ncbi:MAG: Energy-coupling factor transporter ATPase [Thermodesulfobacteriota bacterium]|nr:Energy-coupling factor transporter ATPase [Thermodesulfobacteriota bacterium]
MIKVEDLSYQYETKGNPVLNGISLEIQKGAYVGVIGPNGCGKTTFVRHLNGLLTPTAGEVWVEGMNTRDTAVVQEIRQRVGMVFQNPDNQIVGMSVEEDVAFGPGNLRLPPLEIRKRVEESLAVVGMEKYAQRPPHNLSSGEKQLVAIAGVLAMRPECIVLDEPTTYLDPSARERVLEVVAGLNTQGMTIVHVTHDMDEIAQADEVVVLHEGRIALRGRPSEVFTRVEWLRGLGVGIPRVTEVLWRLRQGGVDVRTDIFALEDACLELAALIRPRTG